MSASADIVIIGGGISGLTTAWWLQKAGHRVVVLDRASEPGGTMRTIRDGDWMIEAGPNSALATTPLFQTLFDDLHLQDEVIFGNEFANRRYILRDGQLHVLPMSPRAFLSSRLWSVSGKARLLLEPFIGRGRGEESIAQFVQRRLGKELLDYAINPFVAGVFAGDPQHLSVQAAFPKLYALEVEYRSLILGQILGARKRAKRAEKSKDRARLFSFRSGMQTLPNALARELGSSYVGGADVVSIQRSPSGFVVPVRGGREVNAKVVLTAVPTLDTSRMLSELAPSVRDVVGPIPYPPVVEVFHGFRREHVTHPLDGFGFLVPELERRNILGSLWSSTLFPGRAPAGHVALTTFVGGSRQPDLTRADDPQLQSLVLDDLKRIVGITGEPVYTRVTRWERAIPQYRIGHLGIVEKLQEVEARFPGLFVSGNFIGGISVGDCVMQSERNAQRIIRFLHSR